MKMKMLLVTVASFILSFSGCSKDPIITEATPPTTEKPTTPVKPVDPTEPVKPTEPTKPGDFTIPADQKEYYAGVDFTKTGIPLKDELNKLMTNTHTKFLSYKDIWEASKATDYVPVTSGQPTEIYLIYGHKDKGNSSDQQAYTRDISKQNKGGSGKDTWNREHTYAQALGTPALGQEGPGADGHHLRPADVGWNGLRSNQKFAKGEGLSGSVNGGWYPGNEWKGDVARMMMYMYISYGNRCLPSNVTVGQKNSKDSNMIDLLLEWNAADPVSEIEKKRNEYHGNRANPYAQGNRNPFIDNPNLATQIWGGTPAKNLWTK